MKIGDTFTVKKVVTEDMTAAALGSGGLPVFGTPYLVAMVENAAFTYLQQELPEDKATVSRARRIQRFLSQPFHVAENFTGVKGAYVKMEDTIRGFQAILGGECDDLPEQAFLMCGTIDEVLAKRDQFR